jgi:DNA invertase Pin-like site-specific DNA recombinase
MTNTKVCLLCRVSTQAQDYDYQVNLLTDIAKNRNWEIVKIFANKVSGAKKNEERSEIVELLSFVKSNKIDKILCTEISRLGRSTLEALKVIETLNEAGVCLYLANYGLETLTKDRKVNPTCHLLCTILLEVSQMERSIIRNRMAMGYQDYLNKRKQDKENHPLGRPTKYKKSDNTYREQYQKELTLLRKGVSLRNVSKLTGTSIGTLRKIKIYI